MLGHAHGLDRGFLLFPPPNPLENFPPALCSPTVQEEEDMERALCGAACRRRDGLTASSLLGFDHEARSFVPVPQSRGPVASDPSPACRLLALFCDVCLQAKRSRGRTMTGDMDCRYETPRLPDDAAC